MSPRRQRLLIGAALVVVATPLAASLFAATAGLTYDEPVYLSVAERHLSWYGNLLRGDTGMLSREGLARHWGNAGRTPVEADWQPPLAKLVMGLSQRTPLNDPFARLRLGNTLLYALTAALLFAWLAAEHSLVAGLGAAIAWLALPAAAHHGNLATLDGPVACLSTAALWAGWVMLRGPGWRAAVRFGVLLGLAGLGKFNAAMVVPAVVVLAMGRRRAGPITPPLPPRRERGPGGEGAVGGDAESPPLPPRRESGPGGEGAVASPWPSLALATLVVAPLVFWALWPWLWYDGVTHLRQVLAFHGRHAYVATGYWGRIWGDPPAPWHYPFVMLAITTPPLVLLTALLGAGQRRGPVAPLLVGLACHLLPFALPGSAKYNGVRLFLPALPLLCGLSGLGLAALVQALAQRWQTSPRARRLSAAALALLVYLPGLVGLLEVYPYPTAYYNGLIGGDTGALRRGFELTYWGEPFREAMVWLSQPGQAAPGDAVYLQPPGAIAMVELYRGTGHLRRDLQLVNGPEGARRAAWFVYQNRPSEWDPRGAELLRTRRPRHVVMAGGAPVAYIWDRGDG